MAKSVIIGIVCFIFYQLIAYIIFSAVSDKYGSDSVFGYITIIVIGPIFMLLIGTNEKIRSWFESLDDEDQ